MANHWAHLQAHQAKPNGELRLDPCHLPQTVAFTHEQKRVVGTLNERNIFLEEEDSGISHLILTNQFYGIAASTVLTQSGEKAVALDLLHKNAALSIPLLVSFNTDDVLLDWRLWADTYDLPMLLIDEDGSICPVEENAPLRGFSGEKPQRQSHFLLRCRGRSLGLRLVVANQVMLG